MKIIRQTTKPNGVVRMTIELDPNESLRTCRKGQTLVLIDPDKHYKLGEPMREDVISGHILADAKPAHWCSLEQKWID